MQLGFHDVNIQHLLIVLGFGLLVLPKSPICVQVTGNLEVKKQICEHGGGPVTFTSKWNTDNIVNSTLEIQVKLPL